jgi:micrococcal nuclease
MNKKMIAFAIIPIIGLIFIVSTPEPSTQNSPDDITATVTTITPEPSKQNLPDDITEPTTVTPITESSQFSSQNCLGNAGCITGIVTKIIDGDTIHVDDQSIRFALTSAPELKGFGGVDSRNFIQTICPIGSKVLVDEDDRQIMGSYGRVIGMVTCNGVNLNEELLDANLGYLEVRFCSSSEFAKEFWAIKHGCTDNSDSKLEVSIEDSQSNEKSCNPSYPDVCIDAWPPDLDCGDIPYRNFQVLYPDEHKFDGDKDGTGCES